jgi:hypothetical protein
MKKGVKFIDLLGIVQKLQSTEGTSWPPLPGLGAESGMDILTFLGEDVEL